MTTTTADLHIEDTAQCTDKFIKRYLTLSFIALLVMLFSRGAWLFFCFIRFWQLSEDHTMLINKNIKPPKWGWALLGGVYIWKRSNILKKKKTLAWVAITLHVITSSPVLIFICGFVVAALHS